MKAPLRRWYCSNSIVLLISGMTMLPLTSCFTGVESTPKITDKEVRRQTAEVTPEDTYIDDIPEYGHSTAFYPGKAFIVSDRKIKLILDASANNADINQGDTLRFASFAPATTVDGQKVTDIVLKDNNDKEYYYRTSISPESIKKGHIVTIPFTVDLDLVKAVSDKLKGNTYFIVTRTRYDLNDNLYNSRRFVPVRIESVDPGNSIYPIRITASEAGGKPFRLYMSAQSSSNMPRKFATLFSLTDPKISHPEILPKTWQNIIDGKVETGMTRDECRLALGPADNVDRQPTYNILREVWTYKNGIYLIFADGILETYRQ